MKTTSQVRHGDRRIRSTSWINSVRAVKLVQTISDIKSKYFGHKSIDCSSEENVNLASRLDLLLCVHTRANFFKWDVFVFYEEDLIGRYVS